MTFSFIIFLDPATHALEEDVMQMTKNIKTFDKKFT